MEHTVVIVDDNAAAADAMVRLIEALGYHARAHYSARDALDHIDTSLGLMLIDIGMPEMDGYELLREVRARNFTQPVIALTGYGQQEDKDRALNAGFTQHLTKPIGLSEVRAALSLIPAPSDSQ